MTNINLIKCNYNCFKHETFKFFGEHKANNFIVSYRFLRSKHETYGFLETHINGSGDNMLVLNGQFLYQYGEKCIITGYCPIEIKNNEMSKLGVMSMGLRCPIIKEGDNIADIAVKTVEDYVINGNFFVDNKDVLCITESIVARAQGNYVTVDDIVQFLTEENYDKQLMLVNPIMSRNRFSVILRAFARYADKIKIVTDGDYDEVGNPVYGINRFTGVDIMQYYREICESENCEFAHEDIDKFTVEENDYMLVDCMLHSHYTGEIRLQHSLSEIMNRPVKHSDWYFSDFDLDYSGFNGEYGVLGSNKADDETLKLFPRDCNELCEKIQARIKDKFDVDIEVLVYGDGCFKDPIGGIWEFADPVTCPGHTNGLEGTPNELKLKALADGKFGHLSGDELKDAITNEIKNKGTNLVGSMASQGTTPRRYIDLLASLADLTSGSGDKGTPMVYIKNYFNNYSM